jgi:hypothetical protein
MIYLYTKFHIFISNSQLVIAIKPKATDNFCMATMFHILRKSFLKKVDFFKKIYYKISFPDSNASCTSTALISQVQVGKAIPIKGCGGL